MSYMTLLSGVTNPIFQNGNVYVTYGYMCKEYGGNHYGADLTAGKGCADYVVADEDGIVEYVKNTVKGTVSSGSSVDAFGNNIKIRHSANDMSRFCHLKYGSITVKVGDVVKKGQVIGYMGNTGYSFGAHVHYERHINGKRVDPEPYLTGKRKFTVDKGIKTLTQRDSKRGLRKYVIDYKTTDCLNMRKLPNMKGQVLNIVPKGGTVKVINSSIISGAITGWYRVLYNGVLGYCSKKYLKKV